MFKYVLKRIGYMFLVLFILSIVIFMIYNLTPSNRAYTDAKADQVAMKQQLAGMSAEAQAKWFEERYEMYQISYGTETNNMILRYLRWVGLYPYADNPYTGKEGKLNGLLQGNFGYSYQYKKDVVSPAPCAKTANSTASHRSLPSSATACRASLSVFCLSGSSALCSAGSRPAA